MYGSQCCARNNGTRGVVEIVIQHEAQPSVLYIVPLSRAQHVLPYIKLCVGDLKGGDQENRRSERKRGREARGAPSSSGLWHRLSRTPSSKGRRRLIPAKRTLVRGYCSKGGGQEKRKFRTTRSSRSALPPAVCVTV